MGWGHVQGERVLGDSQQLKREQHTQNHHVATREVAGMLLARQHSHGHYSCSVATQKYEKYI